MCDSIPLLGHVVQVLEPSFLPWKEQLLLLALLYHFLSLLHQAGLECALGGMLLKGSINRHGFGWL